MRNWDDVTPARVYHERTKHSFESVRTSGHRLDWANRPNPFKEYRGIESVPLPEESALGRLLRWSAGVVRSRDVGGGDVYHFRTYASAGALYPVEVYVANAALPGVPAGLYHFHPGELSLGRLRAGDYRAALADAADAPELGEAEAVLVLSGILWRTAWKYQARGYRHLYWDAGTILANLLALAEAPRLLTGFLDERVNELVGVDGRREAALALLAVGRAERAGESRPLEPLASDVAPLSPREGTYPEAEGLHAASNLTTKEEIRRYQAAADISRDRVPEHGFPRLSDEPLETVLRRRGSARSFTSDPIPADELGAILGAVTAATRADVPPLADVYLVANAVEGMTPGAYRFEPPDRFQLIKAGAFRGWAGYLCLEQEHGARAAATHFTLTDLERTLAALGNRGYRAAQLEGGIRIGRIYVGAYARGYGATGLTFYDDDVARFFTGDTALQPMTCAAAGPYHRSP